MEYLSEEELIKRVGPIDLTEEEKELLSTISLDWREINGPSDAYRNGEAAAKLTRNLIDRKAIPEARVKYFTDPEYKPGPSKGSRFDILKNGNNSDYALTHPNYLSHLRYFLYGADLPRAVVVQFCRYVADCGYVSSSDVDPLRKLVRKMTRDHGLNPSSASDEFCKLSLDCGMGIHYADSIRRAVMQVK